jgi:hypothetical protein
MQSIIDGINQWMPGITDSDLLAFLKLRFANTIESPPDPRDHSHQDNESPPDTIDWNRWVGPIENQTNKPRCVCQSIEVAARVQTNQQRNTDCYSPTSGQTMVDYDAQELYYLCKRHDGIPDVPGTHMRVGLKMYRKHGLTEIRPQANQRHHCRRYWRCRTHQEALNDLLSIGPVLITVRWFMSFSASKTGVLVPKAKDSYVGLHALTLTKRDAQDNRDDVTRGINSFGTAWGHNGHFVLPDNQWDTLVRECWCTR